MHRISLQPRDVGFDLRVTKHVVKIPPAPVQVDYLNTENFSMTITAACSASRRGLLGVLNLNGYVTEAL